MIDITPADVVLVTFLQVVLDSGIRSIAVVLKHAAIYPEHEKLVGQLATDMGFKQVRYNGNSMAAAVSTS